MAAPGVAGSSPPAMSSAAILGPLGDTHEDDDGSTDSGE